MKFEPQIPNCPYKIRNLMIFHNGSVAEWIKKTSPKLDVELKVSG
jgi:hypothetical protein